MLLTRPDGRIGNSRSPSARESRRRTTCAAAIALLVGAVCVAGAIPPAAITIPNGRMSAIRWTDDGHVVVLGTHYYGGVWSADSRDGVVRTSAPDTFVFPVRDLRWEFGDVSPDGATLATFEDRGSYHGADVALWDIESGEQITVLHDGGGPVVFSPDGAMLATGRARGGASSVLWDVVSQQEIAALEGAGGPIAFFPGGEALATGGLGQAVALWRAVGGSELARLETGFLVQAIAVSPDGLRLAAGGPNGEVQLWDVATRQEIATRHEHAEYIASLAFSPDGAVLASGSGDRTVRMWDGRSGAPIATLYGHTNRVARVAFSPDGGALASGGLDGRIQRWTGPPWRSAEIAAPSGRGRVSAIDPGVNGVVYNCAFPNTPDVDGLLIEPVWDNAPWHAVDHTRTTDAYHHPGEAAPGPTDDGDASYEFAMVADDDFLYIALRVTDDYLVPRPPGVEQYGPDGCPDRFVPVEDIALQDEGVKEAPHTPPGGERSLFTVAAPSLRYHDSIWIEPLPEAGRPQLSSDPCTDPVWLDLLRDGAGWSIGDTAPADTLGARPVPSKVAMTRAAWGYRVEMAIPFTDAWPWNITPSEGVTVPFNIGLIDADAPLPAGAEDSAGYVSGSYLWPELERELYGGRAGMGPTPQPLASEYRAAMPWGWMDGGWGVDAFVGDLRFMRVELSAEIPAPAPGGTLSLGVGLNLVHVPARVDGLTSASDLYEALGGPADVSVLLAPDAAGKYLAYTDGVAADSAADFPVASYSGVIAVMRRAKMVPFVGSALPAAAPLHRGINQIGIPRRTSMARIGDLYDLSPAVQHVVRLVDGRFVAVVSDATDAPVEPGVGYLVVASDDVELALDGEPWRVEATLLAAPAGAEAPVASGTPVMVLTGTVVDPTAGAPVDALAVRVTDVATGVHVDDVVGATAGSGRFQAAFVRLGSRFAAGDELELAFVGAGADGSDTPVQRVTLTEKHLRLGVVAVAVADRDMLLASAPERTGLLANYPNPFNPETWISFDLAEPSDATMAIHDASGRIVRRLDLGRRPAGSYRGRDTAIHWDGRNEQGETVAGGVYYAEMSASGRRHVRRLVVVK